MPLFIFFLKANRFCVKPESSKLKEKRAQIQESLTLKLQGQRESSVTHAKLSGLCGQEAPVCSPASELLETFGFHF